LLEVSEPAGGSDMVKIPEAAARLFGNVFVCRKCKHKQRANPQKILARKIVCRKCGSRAFRPKRKEKKAVV